jgi:hypothetical protein
VGQTNTLERGAGAWAAAGKTAATPLGRDARLRISRRIDFRFLLPDPALRRVALCGPHDDDLRLALEHFSERFAILDARPSPSALTEPDVTAAPEVGGFDVVVHRPGGALGWEDAARCVAPDGFLYAELERLRMFALPWKRRGSSASLRRFATPAQTRRVLERAGFRDVRLHWHRPDFRSCREILPLDDPEAVRYALRREGGSRSGELALALARFAHSFGALGFFAPCISVLARRGRAGAGPADGAAERARGGEAA